MNGEEIRGYLREMRDDPVPADSLARVRRRVEEQTRRPRWFGAWWKAAIVVPLPILSLLLILLIRREPSAPPAPQAKPQPVARTQPAPAVAPKPAPLLARRVPPPRPQPRPEPRKSEVSNLIRIETEDPNVVIMLVAE